MTVVDWLALGVLVVAVAASSVVLGLRAFDAWRAFRSLRRSLGRELGELDLRVSRVEKRLALAGQNAAKLDDARKRLERSLSTAALLAGAAGETRAALRRISGVLPRK